MKVSVREVGGKGKDVKKEGEKAAVRKGVPAAPNPKKTPHDESDDDNEASGGGIVRGENAYTEAGKIKYVNPLSLGITEWNPEEIPLDSFIICFGKRRTGKSFWTRDFFNKVKGQFWHVNVYTGSKTNGFYQEFVEDKYIIKGFQPQGLRNLMDIQDHLKEAKLKGDIPWEAPINAMVWLDDVIQEDEIRCVVSKDHNPKVALCDHPHSARHKLHEILRDTAMWNRY